MGEGKENDLRRGEIKSKSPIGSPYFSIFSNQQVSLTLEGTNANTHTHAHTRAHTHTHTKAGRGATLSKNSLHIKLKIRGPEDTQNFKELGQSVSLNPANKISMMYFREE